MSPLLCAGLLTLSPAPAAPPGDDAMIRAYVGTYTGGKSEGIYVLDLDPATGHMAPPRLAADVESPSFVALHPDGEHLYSVSEMGGGRRANSVTAFSIKTDGTLTELNSRPSGGPGAAHVAVGPDGGVVIASNYGAGSVSSIPVNADGSLAEPASVVQHVGSSVNPKRQGEPHAHSANVDATGRFAVVCDLGMDKLLVYAIDPETKALTPHDPAYLATEPGGGPRHFSFHPDGRFAYANLELTNRLLALRWDADAGTLDPIQSVSTLPDDFTDWNSTAETLVHPSGKFVYVSNRGHNSVAVFAIDPDDGTLTFVEREPTGGETPRGFGIDPSGRFLLAANQDSDTVVAFRIDPDTGALDPTGSTVEVGKPVNVRMTVPGS